ncbi:hypothetical protein NDU88_002953 [Pleurodeles waltl]|uniref:Uncharacterized protein n=1 Tax=Pleurodeles waltl TaxID=8319 RepID=A0AAV7T3E0_PLEWA|nr:hypothetical protein NDU88_002953 [Pleurodeles waltl]
MRHRGSRVGNLRPLKPRETALRTTGWASGSGARTRGLPDFSRGPGAAPPSENHPLAAPLGCGTPESLLLRRKEREQRSE